MEYYVAMSLNDDDKRWIRELMEEQLAASESRYLERLERVETTLLTEFHKWASPLDARMRTHTAAIRAIDLEIESVADRVTTLEGKR